MPSTSKRRRPMPTRAEMLVFIDQAEGNITKLSAILEVTRPTVYAWLDRLELSDRVGVSSSYSLDRSDEFTREDRSDDLYSKDRQDSKHREDGKTSETIESTEKYVKPRLVDRRDITQSCGTAL